VVELHHAQARNFSFLLKWPIANALKLGCSGESEITTEIDDGAWYMVCPPHNINMAAI
jgi:hypothetical protein